MTKIKTLIAQIHELYFDSMNSSFEKININQKIIHFKRLNDVFNLLINAPEVEDLTQVAYHTYQLATAINLLPFRTDFTIFAQYIDNCYEYNIELDILWDAVLIDGGDFETAKSEYEEEEDNAFEEQRQEEQSFLRWAHSEARQF
jgi:hypothetical protein